MTRTSALSFCSDFYSWSHIWLIEGRGKNSYNGDLCWDLAAHLPCMAGWRHGEQIWEQIIQFELRDLIGTVYDEKVISYLRSITSMSCEITMRCSEYLTAELEPLVGHWSAHLRPVSLENCVSRVILIYLSGFTEFHWGFKLEILSKNHGLAAYHLLRQLGCGSHLGSKDILRLQPKGVLYFIPTSS